MIVSVFTNEGDERKKVLVNFFIRNLDSTGVQLGEKFSAARL